MGLPELFFLVLIAIGAVKLALYLWRNRRKGTE